MKVKNLLGIVSVLTVVMLLSIGNQTYSQTQRNPVLEEFTGTWCQWCPCGHTIMAQILAAMPNAVMIGYHGGGGGDPFQNFPGNQIVSMMNVPYWPSGTVDRTGAPGSRDLWVSQMNQRYNVPATVSINMDWWYNPTTRELDATVDVTALENLTGSYRMTMILLEDGIVYNQTGNGTCPGNTQYVHNHVVRCMINGATGEDLNGGVDWGNGEVISKDVLYTVPEEFVADNCELVVLVHKVAAQIYNSEIQQAEKYPLVSPDYVVAIDSSNLNVITDSFIPAEFNINLRNNGLLDDTYDISANFNGPAGWTGQYTTSNGTFNFGETDALFVSAGFSETINVKVFLNGINGAGATDLEFASQNGPGLIATAQLKNVTIYGIDAMVIDATGNGYGEYILNSISNIFPGTASVISRNALNPSISLDNYQFVAWSTGNSVPVFLPDEVDALQNYLDNGGKLFINGQNIGDDVFGTGGQSQFAQDFYNNYLHAEFGGGGTSYLVNGIQGDPITDGISFIFNFGIYPPLPTPDMLTPFDGDASSIFKYLNGPNIAGIKATTAAHQVVYFGFCFEQIPADSTRDTLVSRIINYFNVEPGQYPSAPELISPTNLSVIDSSSTLFVWRGSQPQVSKYWLQLDTTEQFSNPYVNSDISDTTFLFTGLVSDKNYWWRVRAFNDAGWGDFSSAGTFSTLITGIKDNESQNPIAFNLEQNYPNPFNPSTIISYSIPNQSHVTLRVFDILGNEVITLVDEVQQTNNYSVKFDASELSSGIYFYKLQAGDYLQTKKMILIK